MDALFQFPPLVFTLAVAIAMAVWLTSLMGLMEFGSPDADLAIDTDASFDVDGGDAGIPHMGNLWQLVGLGMVPASLLFTLVLFLFGWLGLAAYSLLPIPGAWLRFAAAAPLALVCAVVGAALLARPMAPWFRDYGQATRSHELVGRIAVLSSTEFSTQFGLARLKLDDGTWLEVPVRADTPDDAALPAEPGLKLVLTRFEPASNLYFATRLDG